LAINRDKVYDGAMKLLTGGKFDKAIAEFQKLLVDDPKDVRTLLKIADTLHVKMGNRKEALVHYDKAATLYTEQGFFLKAVAVFKQMLTVDATNPELHLRLAELYQQLGYGSQCLLHYQQVVVLYEQQEQPKDKVLDILKRMVDLDPENLASRIKVAELFAQAGKVQEAAGEMRAAYDYLKAQQRVDDALRVGERILAFDAAAIDVARDLATLYMQRQDAKQALAKLQMCFKVDPRNVEVLGAIAEAFRALDQVPKTISVYKEIARIHEGNNDKATAREFWEKVLALVPVDDDAELALGRRAATVVAGAAAPAAPARPSAEDEQLQRLLTETDVYVKYGLRDKAIEHLDKIFAIRPDHLPGLEKLKQLQTQTKQSTVDTLKRLIARGSEVNHPKVAEWKAELDKAGQQKPAAAPAPKPAPAAPPPARMPSAEGEVILVEEEPAPAPKPPPTVSSTSSSTVSSSTKKPPPTLRGAQPKPLDEPAPAPVAPVAFAPVAAPVAPFAAPLDPAFDEPLEPKDAFPTRERREPGNNSPRPEERGFGEFDEPLEPMAALAPRGTVTSPPLPPDESFDETSAPGRQEIMLDEAVEAADADALVRAALADVPAAQTLPELPADEELAAPAPISILAAPAPLAAPLPAPLPSPLAAPLGADFDDFDALAAAAVRESANELMLSDDEVGELQAFVEHASQEGAPLDNDANDANANEANDPLGRAEHAVTAPAPVAAAPVAALPPEFSSEGDDFGDFGGERTIAYGMQDLVAQVPKASAPPAPSPTAVAFDAAAAALPAAPSSTQNPFADTQPQSGEFDPNEFDLPDDVKAMLAPSSPKASSPRPSPFPEMGELGNGELPGLPTGTFDAGDLRGGATLLPDELPDLASVPSLASSDAEAVIEVPPPVVDDVTAPVAAVDDADIGAPSQSRDLFAPARGFEDDPANTFFPDELAEAEFFIQQDLLDEAREILEPILEEVDDSPRVQHMLARVAAKENGEPEPPAPWEQRLIDDVAAELDSLSFSQPPASAAPQQVSVEEVLSQFKKGIAETVPEDDAATHYDLGIAYREMGLLDDAVSEFEISARAPSKAADSWYLVGLVRLDQGRVDDAVAALERAFFSATATEAQKAAAEYTRGVILADHKGDGVDALAALKRARDLGGNAPDLERRISALAKIHGDVPAAGRDAADRSVGRPKNIDYV
jgi:tetratricopeptide (TPR) repeat protein